MSVDASPTDREALSARLRELSHRRLIAAGCTDDHGQSALQLSLSRRAHAEADLLAQAAAALDADRARIGELEREREELRLAICGGEDAPGYAASLPLGEILSVLRDNYGAWREASDRSTRLEGQLAEAVKVLEPFAKGWRETYGAEPPESWPPGLSTAPAYNSPCGIMLVLEDFRAAAARLATLTASEGDGNE